MGSEKEDVEGDEEDDQAEAQAGTEAEAERQGWGSSKVWVDFGPV